MQKIVPFQNYFGGKAGPGTYQNIINHIPPHRVFMTLFAGNCGIYKHIRPAEFTIINDIDRDVIAAWDATGIGLRGDVTLLNVDARSFLREDLEKPEYYRQKEHIFIYLDPPYLMGTRRSQIEIYKHGLSIEDHTDLLSIISAMSHYKIMISHYPCDLYDTMLSEWNTFGFQSNTRQGMVNERIYMNYELGDKLHDYQYIGENFRIRERHLRIKRNFFAKLDRMEPLLRNSILQEYELKHRKKIR